MRYVGIVSVFAICAASGIYAGQMGRKKIMFYAEFKRVLAMLKSEIRYGIVPIGEACSRIAEKTGGTFGGFLKEIAVQTKQKSRQSFPEIWEQAVETMLPRTFFSDHEWKQLKQIGSALGYLDVEMQLKTFSLLQEQIDRSLGEARVKQEKDGKLYQTLGIGIGLMLAIVLI